MAFLPISNMKYPKGDDWSIVKQQVSCLKNGKTLMQLFIGGEVLFIKEAELLND